jgi:polyphenol oxidase
MIVTPTAFADRFTLEVSNKAQPIDLHQWVVQHNMPMYQMVQVHGGTVLTVDEHTPNLQAADAVITKSKSIAVSIRFADCQNIVLYDPIHHVLGCVHAGYKGLVYSVISNTITAMNMQYGTQAATLIAISSASLQQECAEFSDPITELSTLDPVFFNKRNVNLVAAARAELLANGVARQNIELSSECTTCNNTTWFSYRGDPTVQSNSALRNVLIARLL